MNILIFSWRGPGHPFAGGAEISTHEHAKYWVKAGHSVTLFTSFYKGAKKEEIIDGVEVIRQGYPFLGVQWKAFWWYLTSSHSRFDLVIDQFHGIPFFTPFYVREKILAFIHEVAKEVWDLNPWPWPINWIPRILGYIFEPVIFKLFYKNILFMTVSESTKKDLVEWGILEKNITVVHNGLSILSIKKVHAKEKRKTVIFLGAITKDKGIEKALEVFSILNKATSDFQFWVVGKSDPGYLKILKEKTFKLRIDTKTKFYGFLAEDEKFSLLERAHILINTSIREGWGLVVIEAASVGTPTIAFNVPGLRDSIKDNETGILSKEATPDSLAKSIVNLLSDSERYNKISHNAKNWSKNFSWEKSTKMSLEFIERIIE